MPAGSGIVARRARARVQNATTERTTNETTNGSTGVGVGEQTDPIESFVESVVQAIEAVLTNLVGAIPDPYRLVAAALVLVVGYYTAQLVVRVFGRMLAQRFKRPSVTRTVLRSVRLVILAVTLFVTLTVLGVELGNVLISVTVFSAVVGIVLAPIVGSVINGLFVLADQPYEIGDMIEITDTGTRGFVEDITIRYTKVFTMDNTFIVIPNSTIRDRDVVNYSAEDERTRLTLQILVTYEGDLAEARRLIEQAAREVDVVIEGGPDIRIGAARYPAGPTCYIDEFADHGVLLNLRYWAKQPYKLLRVRSRVQTAVWDELNAADVDVEFAYPHSHLLFDETSGTARVNVDTDGVVGPGSDGRDGTGRSSSETVPDADIDRPD